MKVGVVEWVSPGLNHWVQPMSDGPARGFQGKPGKGPQPPPNLRGAPISPQIEILGPNSRSGAWPLKKIGVYIAD